MLVVPPGFTTRRLRLRHPTLADAKDIFAYASDPEVTLYLEWPTQESVASVEEFLRGCLERLAAGTELTWSITLRDDGQLIGMISCRMRERDADFGCVLHRAYWGRGFAPEAASAVVGWLSGLEHLERIWATCDAANIAAARVLEKVGLVREEVRLRATVRPNIGPEPRDAFFFVLPGRGGVRVRPSR